MDQYFLGDDITVGVGVRAVLTKFCTMYGRGAGLSGVEHELPTTVDSDTDREALHIAESSNSSKNSSENDPLSNGRAVAGAAISAVAAMPGRQRFQWRVVAAHRSAGEMRT